MRIHFLIHESFESPGAIEDWAIRNTFPVSYTRFYKHESLPDSNDNFDFLVVMGGPQSPATTVKECSYFDARSEIDFIKKAIDAEKYVLGVCLGAQLIGEALGAPFDHSPNREIGVFDITLTLDGENDPVFTNFSRSFPVGHWHGDMPGLTPSSTLLATSKGCPRQIVRYTPKVYGFQCHFEFTAKSIEEMIQNSSEELNTHKLLPFVENPDTLRSHDYSPINEKLFKFLDYMNQQFVKNK